MSSRFNAIAPDWDKNDMKSRLSHYIGTAMLEKIALKPSMHLMDFGAGTGLLSAHVADKVEKVAAVDIAQGMLDELMKKEELSATVTPYCQNILHDPLEGDFDGIISAMALHHIEDTDEIVKVFYDHLKPGGFIALADLDREDGTFHPEDVEGVFHLGFEREALKACFEAAGFHDITFTTAHNFEKENGRIYPIFLLHARK